MYILLISCIEIWTHLKNTNYGHFYVSKHLSMVKSREKPQCAAAWTTRAQLVDFVFWKYWFIFINFVWEIFHFVCCENKMTQLSTILNYFKLDFVVYNSFKILCIKSTVRMRVRVRSPAHLKMSALCDVRLFPS